MIFLYKLILWCFTAYNHDVLLYVSSLECGVITGSIHYFNLQIINYLTCKNQSTIFQYQSLTTGEAEINPRALPNNSEDGYLWTTVNMMYSLHAETHTLLPLLPSPLPVRNQVFTLLWTGIRVITVKYSPRILTQYHSWQSPTDVLRASYQISTFLPPCSAVWTDRPRIIRQGIYKILSFIR